MSSTYSTDIISVFARHPVAANLLMILMILVGIWALNRLNSQFFPNFELDRITIRVVWSGAAAEDVQTAITELLERELRNLDGLRKMTSTSANGVASLTLEYQEDTDVDTALDEVKQQVDLVRNLPATAEEPEINRVIRYEPIARLMLAGDVELNELRHWARRFERELLARGIAKIAISGLPEEEMALQISQTTLLELGMSLPEIAERLEGLSRDLPAGVVGRDDAARQLRSLDQRRDEAGFARLPLKAGQDGRLVTLGDVADIERRPQTGEAQLRFAGKPAVELLLQRDANADSLASAQILRNWLAETRPQLPTDIELQVFNESWRLIKERLLLLVKNGAGGLLLVIGILFLFLNGRVAFWVAVGIPVSFMATLAALYVAGGSINMISMFALIMALGIIVDDAIVVGEDALAHYQQGAAALVAAESGAQRMLAPVLASSLTTVAAFLPLMLVGGTIGNIMFAIPLVIICVIIASLIESFLVLPGHLRGSLQHLQRQRPHRMRKRLDDGFEYFRDYYFRPLVTWAIDHRWSTLASALALLILSAGLVAGGRLNFTFFPSPEGTLLYASASFTAGSPPEQVQNYMAHVEATLRATEAELGGGLIVASQTRFGQSQIAAGGGSQGDQHGSMVVELTEPDRRTVQLAEFMQVWRQKIEQPAGLESFLIFTRMAGPPGRDIDIRLTGDVAMATLKTAAQELAQALATISGVSAVEDDLPYGKEQWIYRLSPTGEALGLTVAEIGRQLRAAYDGWLVQIYQDGDDEIEVRAVLPDAERNRLNSLESFNVILPDGRAAPLANVVTLQARQGFEALRHAQGRPAVQVSADVDRSINNANKIIASLERTVLPTLAARYGVEYSLEGRSADQAETLADMRRGALLALALIYLVLAWVFASYGWPLVVMMAIPFGVVGALIGHWLLGIDLTILSLFGVFGLAGIVINDSIILVTFYKQQRAAGQAVREALIEAACQRLRAVLLTSLTTIAGLLPLLFEESLQAQFLIPMAVSISFGLAFATGLVLLFVPALLAVYESATTSGQREDEKMAATLAG